MNKPKSFLICFARFSNFFYPLMGHFHGFYTKARLIKVSIFRVSFLTGGAPLCKRSIHESQKKNIFFQKTLQIYWENSQQL